MFKLFAATIAALLVATSAAPKPGLGAVPLAYSSPYVSAYGAAPVVSAYSAPVVSSPYVASPLAYSAYNPVAYYG
ncbi:uncharacterized protein LOC109541733 [Dendroctonus ponderosae]